MTSHPAQRSRVRHIASGWAGEVIDTKFDDQGTLVTVRPDHPRPKEVWSDAKGFVPTPADWPGWKPITVYAHELEAIR